LADEGLIAALAARFSPGYAWSASQLNTLGECGFRFFSQRLLRLEPLEPPREGMDVLQRGRLLHGILEQTYRRIQQAEWPIRPEFAAQALAILDDEAAAAFADAPRAQNFRPRPGWVQEQARLRAQLAAVVSADFAGAALAQVTRKAPAQEPADRYVAALESAYDLPALFETADGQPVRVRGRFDRVDRQGDRWLVVDYKSGGTKIPLTKTTSGRNFQIMIYLLAIRAEQPAGEVGGYFWHLPDQEPSGALWLDTSEGEQTIEQGLDHIARGIGQAQRGDFAVRPNGLEDNRCSRHCDYSQLCRMAVTARRPAEMVS
jgi:ATP-dependent helicase/DNAse subunit B